MKENWKQNKKFYLVIFATMIVQAIRYFPFKFGGWNQIMLSFSYRYGFIQRAFLGTILDGISTVFHIPWGYMRYIYGIFTVSFYTILYFYIIYKALENEKSTEAGFFFKGLALAFFMGPGWVANYSNFALTDIWIEMCSLLAVYLLARDRHVWLSVVVCCIGVLTYPAYVFTYWNLVLVFLLYQVLIAPKKKVNRKRLVLLLVNLLCVGSLFVYMQFYAHVKPGIYLDYVLERTAEFMDQPVKGVSNHAGTITSFLFKDMPVSEETEGTEEVVEAIVEEPAPDVETTETNIVENTNENVDSLFYRVKQILTGWHFYIWEYGLLLVAMAILFAPFFYEIYKYWRMVVQCARKRKMRRYWMYGLLPFGALTVIPCYIVLNDYGRYTNGAFIYEFAIIWLLNRIRDENVVQATKEYVGKVRSNQCYYAFLLCYAAINGTFHQNLINELVSTVETYLWKVVELF